FVAGPAGQLRFWWPVAVARRPELVSARSWAWRAVRLRRPAQAAEGVEEGSPGLAGLGQTRRQVGAAAEELGPEGGEGGEEGARGPSRCRAAEAEHGKAGEDEDRPEGDAEDERAQAGGGS